MLYCLSQYTCSVFLCQSITVEHRGACRTIMGIGHTYMVGLRLRECRSHSCRFFFEAFTVWTAVDTAQNGRITVYGCLISKCAIGSRICCIYHYLKKNIMILVQTLNYTWGPDDSHIIWASRCQLVIGSPYGRLMVCSQEPRFENAYLHL